MEFHEKLQELRKRRGLTQEELSEALYVSRTAISKWESGRGYPNIESLKEISTYFSVSIDDLLSGEKLIFIAEKEHQSHIGKIYGTIFGIVDLFSVMMIVLPLYPKTLDGYVYSVNLWAYTETASYNRVVYWILFFSLIICGIGKIFYTKLKIEIVSIIINIVTVLYLVLAREAYAAVVAILMLIIKGILILKYKNDLRDN